MPGNYTCCVPSCEVTGRNTVPLFRLPTGDVPRLEKFLEFIDRPELTARQPKQLKHYLICALHFEAKYITRSQCRTQLSRSAIPTILDVTCSPFWPLPPMVKLRKRRKRRKREEIELEKKIKSEKPKSRGLPLTKKILKRNAVPSVFSWEDDSKDSNEWDMSEGQWVEETPSDVDGEGQTFAMVVEMGDDDQEGDQDSDQERAGSPEILVYEYEYDGDSLKPVLRSLSSDESSPQKEPKRTRVKKETEVEGVTKPKVELIDDRILTSEQRDVVIEKLNSIRGDEQVRTSLGPKLTSSIEDYITERGNFTKLEQLLRVRHVGPKTVRNLCDKLLGIDEGSPKSRSREPSPGRRTRSPSQVVSPALPDDVCAAVKVLATVVVDLASVSWALVDTKKKILLDWKTILLEDSLSLKDVVVKAALIEKELPAADLCILEDPGGSHSSRSGQMLKSHLSCALATSLHINREDDASTRVAFVKSRLVEKHFNASVGSETISLQPFIADIVDQKVTVGRSNVFIPQDLLGYFKSVEAPSREQLSRAGLLAVSCIDLVLSRGKPARIIKEEIVYESS